MIELALRVSAEIPSYRRGADLFSTLTHINLSKSSLQRLVKRYGRKLVEHQAQEATSMVQVPRQESEVIWREVPEPDSPCMNVSMDGVMIHIRDEGWKEVKVATLSAVTHVPDPENDGFTTQLTHHSYRAGLWDVAEFTKQQWAESVNRGIEKAKYLSSVNDGAPWIWNTVRMCYGRCVEILDWYHAVQRLWTIAHHHFGADSPQASAWVNTQKGLLAGSGLRQILHNIRHLYPRHQPIPEAIQTAFLYLFRNRWRMRYGDFRQFGYPIGSGTVESGCKLVAQTRLKQAGMRWSRPGAQAMLALRSYLLSDRWSTASQLLALS